MFEIVKLGGSRESGIALETRKRTPLRNSQAPEVDQTAIQKFQRLLQRYTGWELRKTACGLYNCFGLVWASRRTAIYDEPAVKNILQDDGYRELQNNESPSPGDVALYYDAQRKSILHVGLICELRQLYAGSEESRQRIPWILSKWNDTSGEVLHHFNEVPWQPNDFTVAFWTERR